MIVDRSNECITNTSLRRLRNTKGERAANNCNPTEDCTITAKTELCVRDVAVKRVS